MSCGESSGPHGIGSAARMTAVRRYEASMYDSNRWDGFELRPGDIIISTPPKCGTTWTQMICALLILQEPELPLPLDTLSPWIDMGLSMGHHIGNTDIGAFLSQRERAAAIDGIELGPLRPPRPRPGGERDRFWQWVDDETPSTQVGVVAAAHCRAPADVPG